MGCKASKLTMTGSAAEVGDNKPNTLSKSGCFGWGTPAGAGDQENCSHAASPETRRAGPPPFAEKQVGAGHWGSDAWALQSPGWPSTSDGPVLDIDHNPRQLPPTFSLPATLDGPVQLPSDDESSEVVSPAQIFLDGAGAGAGGRSSGKGKGVTEAPAASVVRENCTLKVDAANPNAISIEWQQGGFGKMIRSAITNARGTHKELRSDEMVPVIMSSPSFQIDSLPGFTWRMLWSIKDWSEDALSLYLQCSSPGWVPAGANRHAPGGHDDASVASDLSAPAVSGGQDADALCGEAGRNPTVTEGVQMDCKFFLSWNATSAAGASSSAPAPATVTSSPTGMSNGPMIDFDFKHTFSLWDSVWGVQEMLSFRNTDELELQFPESSTMRVKLELGNPVLKTISNMSPPAKLICHSPRMIVLSRFLSVDECRSLMELSGPDLRRSRVTNGRVIENRTSYSTFLTGEKERDARILAIEEKISTHMRNTPLIRAQTCLGSSQAKLLSSAEPLQVVRYNVGEYYRDHFDNKEGVTVIKRAATLIMYLTDVEHGGATYFPKARIVEREGGRSGSRGIRVLPRQGDALLFWNIGVDGREEPNSVHAAEPVEQGQKWICTKWLKLS